MANKLFVPPMDNQRKPHMSQEDCVLPIITKVSGVKTPTAHIHTPATNSMEKNTTQRLSLGKTRVWAKQGQPELVRNSNSPQTRPATKATTFTATPTTTK